MTITDPPGPLPPNEPNNPPPKKNLRIEAENWIIDNAQGFAKFESIALEWVAAGATRLSIKAINEVVRASGVFLQPDARGFRLTNNHAAYIARALIQKHPQLGELFHCKQTAY